MTKRGTTILIWLSRIVAITTILSVLSIFYVVAEIGEFIGRPNLFRIALAAGIGFSIALALRWLAYRPGGTG